MKRISLAKGAMAAGLVFACTMGLAACSSANASSDVHLTGGVAATVNGTEIPEDEITLAIEGIREEQSLTDEDTWGQWMAQTGYTPESVREEVLDTYINKEVLLQHAADKGVTVDDATVQSYVDDMKANYSNDEARWQQALKAAGMTEDEYRDNIRYSLLYRGVCDSFAAESEPSDEDMLSTAQTYAASYDGAKRSSHILFDADDAETAQQVLDQINAGTISFEDAAREYSKDTGSAENGGDVGWDKLTTFVTEYQDALDGLEKGQVSGLVTSTYGIHIIKCTDVFTAPDEVASIDQLPSEFVDSIRTTVLQNNEAQAYSDWLTSCRDSSDVVINDMPADVPYNVDMSKYQTEDSSSADTAGEDASNGDAAEGEATDDGSSAAEGSAGDETADGAADGDASAEGAAPAADEGSAGDTAPEGSDGSGE